MNCSAVLGDFLFIGAYSKLYMIDLKDDFEERVDKYKNALEALWFP